MLLLPGSGRPLLHLFHRPPLRHQPRPLLVCHQSRQLQPQADPQADQSDDQHRVAHIHRDLLAAAPNVAERQRFRGGRQERGEPAGVPHQQPDVVHPLLLHGVLLRPRCHHDPRLL